MDGCPDVGICSRFRFESYFHVNVNRVAIDVDVEIALGSGNQIREMWVIAIY